MVASCGAVSKTAFDAAMNCCDPDAVDTDWRWNWTATVTGAGLA